MTPLQIAADEILSIEEEDVRQEGQIIVQCEIAYDVPGPEGIEVMPGSEEHNYTATILTVIETAEYDRDYGNGYTEHYGNDAKWVVYLTGHGKAWNNSEWQPIHNYDNDPVEVFDTFAAARSYAAKATAAVGW